MMRDIIKATVVLLGAAALALIILSSASAQQPNTGRAATWVGDPVVLPLHQGVGLCADWPIPTWTVCPGPFHWTVPVSTYAGRLAVGGQGIAGMPVWSFVDIAPGPGIPTPSGEWGLTLAAHPWNTFNLPPGPAQYSAVAWTLVLPPTFNVWTQAVVATPLNATGYQFSAVIEVGR